MTSLVAGGLFNAVAFAGAGYLFQKLNKNGYEKEIKRHNLAMEKLTEARQKWNQNEIETEKKKKELRQERSDAKLDAKETNRSLKTYGVITHDNKRFDREPHIWDFYQPSNEMKEYMNLTAGTVGLLGGWTGQKIISKLLL